MLVCILQAGKEEREEEEEEEEKGRQQKQFAEEGVKGRIREDIERKKKEKSGDSINIII